MALKELLTNLPAALSAYPFSSNPSTAGGANYGNSYTAPFDAQTIRQRPFGPNYDIPVGMPSYGDTSYPYTGAPLVTIGLPPVDKESNEILNYVDLVSGGFIRGGLVTAGKRALLDAKRIGKFLISPKGITFIIKQVGLQASNPKIEEPSFSPQTNRIYNLGINTLAQVPASITGLHINRAGLLPTSYRTETGYKVDNSNTSKYGPYYWEKSKEDGSDYQSIVRKAQKLTKKIAGLKFLSRPMFDSGGTPRYKNPRKYRRLRKKLDKIIIGSTRWNNRLLQLHQTKILGETQMYDVVAFDYNTLLSYGGGPNSFMGLGRTRIKRYYNSTENLEVNFEEERYFISPVSIQLESDGNPTTGDVLVGPFLGASLAYKTDVKSEGKHLDPNEEGIKHTKLSILPPSELSKIIGTHPTGPLFIGKTRDKVEIILNEEGKPIEGSKILIGLRDFPNRTSGTRWYGFLGASTVYKEKLEINPNTPGIKHSDDTILPNEDLQAQIKINSPIGPFTEKITINLDQDGKSLQDPKVLIGLGKGFLGTSTAYNTNQETDLNKDGINHNHQYLSTGTWPNLPTDAKYYPYYGDLKSHISTEEKESPFTIFNKQRGNTRVILPNYIQLGGPVSSLLYINNSSLLSQKPGLEGVIPWEGQIPIYEGFNVQLDTNGNPIPGSSLITNPLGASFHYEGYMFEQGGVEVNINPNKAGVQIGEDGAHSSVTPGLPEGVGVQNPDNTVIDTSIYSALILNKEDNMGNVEARKYLESPDALHSLADFRKLKADRLGKQIQYSNYKTQNIETRLGTGNPGYLGSSIEGVKNQPYNVPSDITLDRINALDIFSHEGEVKDERAKDLIKFRIEAIDTDNPSRSDVIIFRAFLENFNDGYTGNWGEVKYAGRGEPLYLYNGFKRSITTTFKVAAQARCELEPLYRKLNFLASNTAPDYGKGTRMRAPYVRLTIGDYFSRLPGFFTGLTFSWKTDYPWEIVLDPDDKDKNMLELPHMLDVQMNFTPIHNFLPQKSITRSTFILPHARDMRLKQEQKWYSREAADGVYNVNACVAAPVPPPPPPPPPKPKPKQKQKPPPKDQPIYIPPDVTLKKDNVQTAGQDIEGDGNSIGVQPGDRYGGIIPPEGSDEPFKMPTKK